jgi:hypothetical protein
MLKAKKSIYMVLVELFISTMLICKFLSAVSHASVSLVYPASEGKILGLNLWATHFTYLSFNFLNLNLLLIQQTTV